MAGGCRHIPCSEKEQLVVMSGYMHPSQIARVTQINIWTVQRVLALAFRTGSVVRNPLQAGRPQELNALDANVGSTTTCLQIVHFSQFGFSTLKPVYTAPQISTLKNCSENWKVHDTSTSQHPQLQEHWDVVVLLGNRSVVYNTLTSQCRFLLTLLICQVSWSAIEQNEERQAEYQIFISENYQSNQLVFLDESACNRTTTKRTHVWASIGSQAQVHDYFIRGKRKVQLYWTCILWNWMFPTHCRYSILPALSLDGILHLDICDGSYTSATFNAFIDGLLNCMNPFPQQNSVLVIDNANIHKSVELREMVEAQ